MTTDGEFLFAGVTNALSVGGVYKLDPKYVDLSDGCFEVILIRMPKTTNDIMDILYRLSNLDYDENQVVFFHTSSVTITSEEPVKWTVDGEYGGNLDKVVIKNLNGAIKIFKSDTVDPLDEIPIFEV